MTQHNDLKLISISKNLLLFLRIFFTLLIIIAILPWLIPTTTLGANLIGVFGVANYAANNFSDVVNHFTLINRILGIIGSFTSLLPLLVGTLLMLKLAKNYLKGQVFNLTNAKSYRNLGITYLLSAILLQPLSQVLFSLCATINNPAGQRVIAISFDVANLTGIFFAIVLIIIGRVMAIGQQLSEEQELTI